MIAKHILALVAVTAVGCGNDVAVNAGVDAAPGPFEVPARCTSGVHWKMGNQRSPLMYPGRACNACHEMGIDTPRFAASGTVYATGHEPDNCNGAIAATVEVTDATGGSFSAVTNDAGNFSINATLAFPIHAKVVVMGSARSMVGAVMTGDCNSCHTEAGIQMAPGRIVLP